MVNYIVRINKSDDIFPILIKYKGMKNATIYLNESITDLNINSLNQKSIDYIYVRNYEEFLLVKKIGKTPHVIFNIGENIEWIEKIDKISEYEIFIKVNSKNKNEIDETMNFVIKNNLPYCPTSGDTLEKNSLKENYDLIKYICHNYKNPQLENEYNLSSSLDDENILLFIENNQINEKQYIMGYFGDETLNCKSSIINKKNILLCPECKKCDIIEKCLNRGIGLIMEKHEIRKCIGPKLYKGNI